MPKNPIVPQPDGGNLPKLTPKPDLVPEPAGQTTPGASAVTDAHPDEVIAPAPTPTPESDMKVIVVDERIEEYHITVETSSAYEWKRFCDDQGITPLFIELGGNAVGRLQLLCEIESKEDFDAFTAALTKRPEFVVTRIKHEVHELRDGEVPLYAEAHVKFDGPYRQDIQGASRDLFRLKPQRWYATRRAAPVKHVTKDAEGNTLSVELKSPLTQAYMTEQFGNLQSPVLTLQGIDLEWVLVDTNPGLDAGWL